MSRIYFTEEQEKEIIEAIVNAGEVEFYGSRKLFSFRMKETGTGKHLSGKDGISIMTIWNQLVDRDWKKIYRDRN